VQVRSIYCILVAGPTNIWVRGIGISCCRSVACVEDWDPLGQRWAHGSSTACFGVKCLPLPFARPENTRYTFSDVIWLTSEPVLCDSENTLKFMPLHAIECPSSPSWYGTGVVILPETQLRPAHFQQQTPITVLILTSTKANMAWSPVETIRYHRLKPRSVSLKF